MANFPLPFAVIDGELLPAEQAGFPVGNQSLVDALGIYETILMENGRFFQYGWHLRRLGESAAILGFDLPAALEEIGQWGRLLMARATAGNGLLRIVAYGGDGSYPATCGLYARPLIHWPAESYQQGVRVTIHEGERFLPLAKSTNCLAQAQARRKARQVGAYDGLIVDRHGHITEGSNCNLLAIREGRLLRPLAGTALEGVTENITAQLAERLGIPVVRTALARSEVGSWEEAFITSTTRRIMPVRQVDDVLLPAAPGSITQRLMEAYRDYEAGQGWEE